MIAILKDNTVIIGKDFAECVTGSNQTGWKFFMIPGINREVKVIGDRTMDEAEKIARHTIESEGLVMRGYAAQRF